MLMDTCSRPACLSSTTHCLQSSCRRTYTNAACNVASQIELIEALHGGRGCLTIVGDDAQSIYTWRDARPRSFIESMERHTLHTLRKLKVNYRSRPYILQCGQAMIEDAAAAGVIPKNLQPARPNDYRSGACVESSPMSDSITFV